MIRKERLPELLAPAGDFDALRAAISGGADAVYVGGKRFGARAFAKNFDTAELTSAVELCHLFGVRLYVTLNTLIADLEIPEALAYARELHKIGVDALIIADLGLAALIRREIPELPLHASTQMGVHNTAGADFAYELGCTRVVLARECSADSIEKIVPRCKPECEVFLHGALCVCHSGQCLMSSMVGGRSGNRGECAQPCRLPYSGRGEMLSLCDLSLAGHIKRLIASGVASLKIEGRMKSPEYVYEVTSIYRKLLDEARDCKDSERARLAAVFSRGGAFTDGYYTGKIQSKMTAMRSSDDKKASREAEISIPPLPRVKLTAVGSFRLGEPSSLTLTLRSRIRCAEEGYTSFTLSATAKGAVPELAENAPLNTAGVTERLAKLGATPFYLDKENTVLDIEEGINLAPSAINELRRCDVGSLTSLLHKSLDVLSGKPLPEMPVPSCDMATKMAHGAAISATFYKNGTLSELALRAPELLSELDTVFVSLFTKEKPKLSPSVSLGVYLPPIIMENEWDAVRAALAKAKAEGIERVLIGNISHIALAKDAGMQCCADMRMNITNSHTRALLSSLGVTSAVLSPELTLPQAADIGGSVITLGRIPLMITERCFIKENFGCDACGRATLTDRTGAKFPILREHSHRNLIFNSRPTYMGDKREGLTRAGLSEHFIFSSESVDECIALLRAYFSGSELSAPHRRIGRR